MTRIHVVLPPEGAAPPPPRLPGFLTDLRPAPAPAGSALALALARAADLAGLAGIVVPYDADGPEPLVTAAGLLRVTRHVTVFAGIQPWIATAQYTAKLSATLQRFSGGRFGWYLDDTPESAAFTARAQEFWEHRDGLPDVLSAHPFPAVTFAGAPDTARLDVRGLAPEAVTALLTDLTADRTGSRVRDLLLTVSHDPGEIYRIGEYVLPQLSTTREPVHVR